MLSWLSLKRFKVNGGSMKPCLNEGDRVLAFTCRKSIQGLKENDLAVAVDFEGRKVVKRVKAVEGNGYWLQGDNTDESIDSRHYGLVSREQIIGRVWKKY
ncbi:S26 family signal peptidase [archaeon]|nr:S26 family signal peptidase [archaeon]